MVKVFIVIEYFVSWFWVGVNFFFDLVFKFVYLGVSKMKLDIKIGFVIENLKG